ncbi:MAG: DUF192 domain-containing protein [Hyphomicrobiales bacterium]|nr:DUF192 domain-containing protein [Hyphomicrobiales bacterium]
MFRNIALALFAFVLAASPARAAPDLEKLTFVTKSGEHAFSVEVMRTPAEHERGLMFRRYLPPDRGMLFDFGKDEAVQMWMKNTYIPLDMVFVGKDGRVVSIAANTEPFSERTIPSGGPVTGVVELNAGAAAKINLQAGDMVRHPMFGR